MVETRLIPDCTFYTLFLKNFKQDYLIKITNHFKTCISPIVKKEIFKMGNNLSKNLEKNLIEMDSRLQYYQLIKPLVSKEEYEKGELDIIILACFCEDLKIDYILVIDERPAFNLIKRCFPKLLLKHKYTGEFIVDCTNKYKILKKDESLNLLDIMEKSDFRIPEKVLQKLKNDLENG